MTWENVYDMFKSEKVYKIVYTVWSQSHYLE